MRQQPKTGIAKRLLSLLLAMAVLFSMTGVVMVSAAEPEGGELVTPGGATEIQNVTFDFNNGAVTVVATAGTGHATGNLVVAVVLYSDYVDNLASDWSASSYEELINAGCTFLARGEEPASTNEKVTITTSIDTSLTDYANKKFAMCAWSPSNGGEVTERFVYNFTTNAQGKFTNKVLKKPTVEVSADQEYNGSKQEPTVTVKDGDTTLALGTDYTLTWSDSALTDVKTYTLKVTMTDQDTYSNPTDVQYKITPKALNVDFSGVTFDARNFNNSTDVKAQMKGLDVSGKAVASDAVSIDTSKVTAVAANKAPGSQRVTISVPAGALTGAKKNNYTLAAATDTSKSITINKAPLNVTLKNLTKTYGDTRNIAAADYTVSGAVNGATPGLSVTSAGSAATAGVAGSPYAITAAITDTTNYTLNVTNTATLTVNQKELSVTYPTVSKPYDKTTSTGKTISDLTLNSVVNSDTVTLSGVTGNFNFADANVGSGKNIDVSALTLAGTNAGNYTLKRGTWTGAITAKKLAAPAAPTGTATHNSATISVANSAESTDAVAKYSYKKKTDSAWTNAISGTISNLAPDTDYEFRAIYEQTTGNYSTSDYSPVFSLKTQVTPSFNIAADGNKTFTAITYGDAQPEAQTVTVTYHGTGGTKLTALTVTGDITNFDITQPNLAGGGIGDGETATFTIRPKANLDANATPYTTTLTISGMAGSATPTATVNATFTVNKATLVTPDAAIDTTATTYNSVTVTVPTNTPSNADVQYAIVEAAGSATPSFGTNATFTGLNPNTAYKVIVKHVPKTDAAKNYNESVAQELNVTTAQASANFEVTAPTFTAVEVGYERPSSQSIKVTNKGATAATISIAANDAAAAGAIFDMSGVTTVADVAAGDSVGFGIQPKAGLAEGTHSATYTVTVTPDGGTAAIEQVTVTFTVNPQAVVPVLTINEVHNIPVAGQDYAYIDLTSGAATAGQTVEVYSDAAATANKIGSVAVTAADITAGKVKVALSDLTKNGGTLYAKVAENAAIATASKTYPAETTLKVNPASLTIAPSANGNLSLSIANQNGYTNAAPVWTISGVTGIATVSGSAAGATVTAGTNTGSTNVKVEVTFTHPEGTFTLDTTVPVTVRQSGGGIVSGGGGGGGIYVGGSSGKNYTVTYYANLNGTLLGKSSETVKGGRSPILPPSVVPREGYIFAGWALTPSGAPVDVKKQIINADTNFYAVYTGADGSFSHIAYVKGYEDGAFRPDQGITRAETAALFARIDGMDEGQTYGSSFNDVDAGQWYAPYIGYMQASGILKGYEDGSFRPDAPISRAEFAALVARYKKLSGGELKFSDVTSGFWAAADIAAVQASGLVQGYPDNTFRPEQCINRAETVQVLNGMLGRLIDASNLGEASYDVFNDMTTAHWAYYQVIEAANQHSYTNDTGKEIWTAR